MVITLSTRPDTLMNMAAKDGKGPGDLLREYREKKGWSLRDVAKRAGLSHGTVRAFEQRTNYEGVQAGTISALARGYGMSEGRLRRILRGEYGEEHPSAGPDQLRVNPDW